jgi:hypothetical protein
MRIVIKDNTGIWKMLHVNIQEILLTGNAFVCPVGLT